MRRFPIHALILGIVVLLIAAPGCWGDGEGLLQTPTLQSPVPAPTVDLPPAPPTMQPETAKRPRLGTSPGPQYLPAPDPRITNQTRQALSFYGGHSARATLSQLPRRTPIRSAQPRPVQARAKPFTAVEHEPTISPYLNLDRPETADDLPNYFVFVRPQFHQMNTNRGQQRELNRLQSQLNTVSSTIATPRQDRSELPGTGTPSRFMDTAQFYGSWQR